VRSLLITLGLVTAAMLATGCGGTANTKALTAPEAIATNTETTSVPRPAAVPDCTSSGMSRRKGAEGTCTADGATITVVNPGHEARLRTLGVTLNGCRAASFARCSLTVRNRSGAPRTFDGAGKPQTMLVVDGRQFYEQSGAGKQAIQPGESLTRDVVYDLAPRYVRDLHRTGNLFVFNFGDDGNNVGQAAMLHASR
jgi:Tfp pilus assembly protein PilW